MSKKDFSETIKNFAEVLALIAVAFWGFYLFTLKEKPGLEVRGRASGSVGSRQLPNSDLVEFYYNVVVENSGSTSFDIVKIHTRAWEIDQPPQTERITFLDIEKAKGLQPFFDKGYDLNATSAFPSHYPPGAAVANTFNWFLRPDCTKWLLYTSDFYEKGEDIPKWRTASWYPECPISTPSPTPSPNPSSTPAATKTKPQ